MLLLADVHFGANAPQDVDRVLETAATLPLEEQVVVVAGDMVQKATALEYEQARELLEALVAMGFTLIITPGNHDFQIPGGPLGTDKVNLIPVRLDRARKRFREMLLSLALDQDETVAHNDHDGYDMITRVGDDVFVTLRSTHRPRPGVGTRWGVSRIRKKQVRWALEALNRMELSEDSRLHLVSHRSMWRSHPEKHPPLKRRKRLEDELMAHVPFETFIHGHNHYVVYERAETPYRKLPLVHVGLPTLSGRGDKAQTMTTASFVTWSPRADHMKVHGPEGVERVELGELPRDR